MFTDPTPQPSAPKTPHAWVRDPKTGDLYVVCADASVGAIDPLFVVLAYAFNRGWNPKVVGLSYEPAPRWLVAARGLEHLAASVSPGGFSFQPEPGLYAPASKERGLAIGLAGADPPQGKVLDSGDIFTPNANGFYNIPRLYLMAALTIELRKSASVAALAVNAEGLIFAIGLKAHGEGGCEHAEVRALFSIKGRVPKRWMMVSTLKPCTMCAGLIQALAGTDGHQFWARDDPSEGAAHGKVKDLSLPLGFASHASAQDEHNLRVIKLASGASFTDRFSERWGGRKTAVTLARNDLPEALKRAYATWCEQTIKPGRAFKYSYGEVRVRSTAEDALAKALQRGSIDRLINYAELFEREQSGSRKVTPGIDATAGEAIRLAFERSGPFQEATKAVRQRESEADMGIIQFIGQAEGSKSLRQAARNALAAKFIKYGKTEQEARSATGSPNATGAAKASTDPRMKPLADYLFNFVKTQGGV